MLVPYNWLKDYVDFDYSADELAEKLTMTGIEVETVIQHGEGISGVVVGNILSVKQHPNADRLVLCDVDAGGGNALEIVCGAHNMKAGDKAPLAVHGATLPGGIRVRKSKIRGVTSNGMLCSEAELQLGEDEEGILILPSHLEVGADLNTALALDEPILDVQVMPNRGDWSSMIGVAREVAVFAGTSVKIPEASFEKGETPIDSLTSVQIDDPEMCPRYAARVVRGVRPAPSPQWMQDRLLKAGLRPINNVVDATNYVLMELGQPLHVFDYDLLAENRIVVRRARQGEKIVTLDGEERALFPDVLVIADAVKPVALAGIMGGKEPEVTDATVNVFIESAFFDPGTIRRGSKKLGLSTEASYRFERGTDPEMVLTAADRAAGLIQELAGGELARGVIDNYAQPFQPVKLVLRPARANALLGTDIPAQDMADMLARLGFSVAPGDEGLFVAVPSHRHDVRREADLIEEVARVHGYDRIPSSSPRAPVELPRRNEEFSLQRRTTDALLSLGMTQAITLTFSSVEDMERIGHASPSDQMVALRNPMSEKQGYLRASLIPGIVRTLERNLRYGQSDCEIFEIGRVFSARSSGEQPDEMLMVTGASMGKVTSDHWDSPGIKTDFFHMKGIVESLLNGLQCQDVTFRKGSHPALSETATAEIWAADTPCGSVGETSRTVLQRFDIEEPVFLFELDLDSVRPLTGVPRLHEPIPKFPPSGRDLAVIVADHVQAEDLTTLIRTTGGDLVGNITLFDLYRGPQVPAGMTSIAFSIKYLASDRTLTDEEVNGVHQKIVEALVVKFHARLREE